MPSQSLLSLLSILTIVMSGIIPSQAASLATLSECVTETAALEASSSLTAAYTTAQNSVSVSWDNIDSLINADPSIPGTRTTWDWSKNTDESTLTAYQSACTSAGGTNLASQDYFYHCFMYDGTTVTGASFVEVNNGPLCVGASCSTDENIFRQAIVEDVIVVNQESSTWTCFGGIYNGDDGITLGCYTDTTVIEDFDTDVLAALESIGSPTITGTTDFTGVTTVGSYATTVVYDSASATTLATPCTAAGGTASTIDSVDAYCVKATTDNNILLAVDYTITNVPRCLASSCSSTTDSDFDIYEWISTDALMANGLLTDDTEALWTCAMSPPACYTDVNGLYGSDTTSSTVASLEVDFTYELELPSTSSTDDVIDALERATVAAALEGILPATCGDSTATSTINSLSIKGMSTLPSDAVVTGDSCSASSSSNSCQVVLSTLTVYYDNSTSTTATALEASILSSVEAASLAFAHADVVTVTVQSSSSESLWENVWNTTKDFVLKYWIYICAGVGALLVCCLFCKCRNSPKRKKKRAGKKGGKNNFKVKKGKKGKQAKKKGLFGRKGKKGKKGKKNKKGADPNQPRVQKAGFVGKMFGAQDKIHLPKQKGWGRRQPQVVVVP